MNELLIVSQDQVRVLLPMQSCIDAMDGVLRELALGRTVLPLRQVLRVPDGRGALAAMPAILQHPAAMGVKLITVFPGNHGTHLDSHQGAVLLFEAQHGSLLAIMDASSITAIRTAAVSAVATRALAREDASVLALIGSGVQASTHLEAMLQVRPIREVRVWSRSAEHVNGFIARHRAVGVPIVAAQSAREAVTRADIVCTVSSATEPVVRGEWLASGTHINAVGSSMPAARELDSDAVARARIYVDRRESALAEAGDLLVPMREGRIGADAIVGELGELLLGSIPGRRDPAEITLFKSLGLAIEDVASAHLIYSRAVEQGVGTRVALGGVRDVLAV